MAFQYNGACYETPESFLQAVAANSQGVSLHEGQPVAYTSTVANGVITTTTSQGQSVSFSPVQIDCQLVDMADAAILSGLVICAWAASWALVVLRNGVDQGGYGGGQ